MLHLKVDRLESEFTDPLLDVRRTWAAHWAFFLRARVLRRSECLCLNEKLGHAFMRVRYVEAVRWHDEAGHEASLVEVHLRAVSEQKRQKVVEEVAFTV